MKNEPRRSGGVFISDLSAESGAATLIEALDLYPGALTLVYLLGVVLDRSLRLGRIERTDGVVDAYWKLLEKRSAWMPK